MGHIPIRTVAFALIALPLSAVSLAQPYGVGEFESEFLQTGLKHWHAVNNTTSFAGGADHVGIASDGYHIWVTNFADGTISKLRANDGTLLGTLAVGSKPYNLAFDGANVWLANHGDNK